MHDSSPVKKKFDPNQIHRNPDNYPLATRLNGLERHVVGMMSTYLIWIKYFRNAQRP
ncbi:MAG: hypothetical protein V4724_22340 [Pseudomonadota bacterium]